MPRGHLHIVYKNNIGELEEQSAQQHHRKAEHAEQKGSQKFPGQIAVKNPHPQAPHGELGLKGQFVMEAHTQPVSKRQTQFRPQFRTELGGHSSRQALAVVLHKEGRGGHVADLDGIEHDS